MTLSSMTGFGGASGSVTLEPGREVAWTWEIKSVNGRGLDVRFRLPTGFEEMEGRLREKSRHLKRGTVTANLSYQFTGSSKRVQIDQDVLAAVSQAISQVRLQMESSPPSADGILALKGVMSVEDEELSDQDRDKVEETFASGFEEACTALVKTREGEGGHLHTVLSGQLDEIGALTAQAKKLAKDSVAEHHATLKKQIADLLAETPIEDARLAQEAALLAVRADVQEEIDRLVAHVEAARQHLQSDEAVGRRLDFLAQEFVREANTLTTKAQDMALKTIGLSLKSVIDQFKEQVQNVA